MERSNGQEKKKCTLRPSQYMKCHIPKTNRLRENKNEFTEKQKKAKLKDKKKHETDVRKKNSSIGKKCIWGNQTCRLQTGREKQRQKWKTSHTHTRTTYTHTWKGSFCLGIASMEKEEILGATPGSRAHRQSTKSCKSHTEIQHLRKDAQKNTHTDHIPYVARGV